MIISTLKTKDWYTQSLFDFKKYLKNKDSILKEAQQPIFKDIYKHLKNVDKFGYVLTPAGSGKTVLFIETKKALNLQTLVVTPTVPLLHQTKAEFESFAPEYSTELLYSYKKNYDSDVIITTPQSLVNAINNGEIDFKNFPLIILDEVHEYLTPIRMKTIQKAKDAGCIVLGFTASDKYNEEKQVRQILKHCIHEITIPEAVTLGLLCPFAITLAETEIDLSSVPVRASGDYDIKPAYYRGLAISAMEMYKNTPYFVTESLFINCATIEQANITAEVFREYNFSAEAIHSKVKDARREDIINAYKIGHIKVLCNVGILARGFDAPIATIVMNLVSTTSLVRSIQRIRNLRRYGLKSDKFAIIVEFIHRNYNKKYPPITFDRVIGGEVVVLPPDFTWTERYQNIQRQLLPVVSIPNIRVHVQQYEVMQVLKEGISYRNVGIEWPSEEELRQKVIEVHGSLEITVNQYKFIRKKLGGPVTPDFPRIYRKTFKEFFTGSSLNTWPSEEDLKSKVLEIHGSLEITIDQYDIMCKKTGGPSGNHFPRIYRKTFKEFFTGSSLNTWPSEEVLKAKVLEINGDLRLTTTQYNDIRKKLGGPNFGHFRKVYQKTFKEFFTGRQRSEFISEQDLKSKVLEIHGSLEINVYQYGLIYKKNNWPHIRSFPRAYNKTFGELFSNITRGSFSSEEKLKIDVLKIHKSLDITKLQYNSIRKKIDGPNATHFPQIYQKTFKEFFKPWPSEEDLKSKVLEIHGSLEITVNQYQLIRKKIGGPIRSDFPRIYRKTFKEFFTGKRRQW